MGAAKLRLRAMPAPPPDARSLSAEVERVVPCGDDGVILAVRAEVELPPVRASRFFMLKRKDRLSPLIPRPFSLYRQHGRTLEFLIKRMGRGTRALADSRPGDALSLVGPLGNGWPTLAGGGAPWVLLAGGVGSAPFFLGIEQALAGMDGEEPARRDELVYLYGAARRGLLYDLERFRALGVRVHTATDDGSEGFRGNVLELLERLQWSGELPRVVRLLACGPHPMLVAVERLAREKKLECWLSLETLMGCGVGICNGCPVSTRPEGPLGAWPNAKCCVEGPVFPVGAITLEHPGEQHGSPRHEPVPSASEPVHEPARGRPGTRAPEPAAAERHPARSLGIVHGARAPAASRRPQRRSEPELAPTAATADTDVDRARAPTQTTGGGCALVRIQARARDS